MANNPYVNKVVYGNSTLIDLSQDTATQADVAQGKYFHLPTGERVQGTASGGGGGGSITQDQDGYLVLSPDGDLPTLITKTITQNGTYDAEDDNADGYSSVTVNVSGGGGGVDIPVFTARYDSNYDLESFSCSMTYAETLAYFDGGNQSSAKFIEFDEDEENPGEYFEYSNACTMDIDDWEAQTPNIICRTVGADGLPITEFTYYPNGTLSTPDDVDIYEFPTLTQNGYYYPTQGKVYSGVYVNVTGASDPNFKAVIARTSATPTLPSDLTTIGAYAFYSYDTLAITALPSSVTSIGMFAFFDCYNLALTTLPSTITSIGQSAFRECENLTTITCNGIITYLGDKCFNGSSSHPMSLQTAHFPYLATSGNFPQAFGATSASAACQQLTLLDIGSPNGIAAGAFNYCSKLQTLIIRRTSVCSLANVSAFGYTPFRGEGGLTGTVYVPSSLISSYQTATNWKTLYDAGTLTFSAIENSIYEL